MTQTFDAYSGAYGDAVQSSVSFSGLPHSFFLRAKVNVLRDEMAARLGPGARGRALDAGCGVGAMHPYLAGLFDELHGVDVSHDSIAQARVNQPDVSYQAYDGVRLPYADGRFDVVLTVCVVHHVLPAQWAAYVAELRRVARPGGLVCVIEHNPFNPLTRLAVLRCPFDADAVLLRAGRAKALLRGAGLRNVRASHFLLFPFDARPLRALERWLSAAPLGAQYMAVGTA